MRTEGRGAGRQRGQASIVGDASGTAIPETHEGGFLSGTGPDTKEAMGSAVDGLAVAGLIAKLIDGGKLKGNNVTFSGAGDQKVIRKLEKAIASVTGLPQGEFIVNPNVLSTRPFENAFFVSLPEALRTTTSYNWTEKGIFGTQYLFAKIVRYLQGVCNGSMPRTAVITADWKSSDDYEWKENLSLIQKESRMSFYLTYSGKATELRYEPMEGKAMERSDMPQTCNGRYYATARRLTKVINSWGAQDSLEGVRVRKLIAESSGIPMRSFGLFPYEKEKKPKKTMFFVSLNEWREYSSFFNGKYGTNFGDTLTALIVHMQGKGRGITKEVVIITDRWDSDAYEFWKYNLKAIRDEAHLEIYLYAGREPNLIEL